MTKTYGSLPKIFIRSQNWWKIFLCKMRNLYPNSFLPEQFFNFLALKLFVSYWLVTFQKKETMKIYSDRLKLVFAQIRPSFKFKFLALVFSVNKWKSILVKKLAACKQKNGGYWLHTMHYSNIPVFLEST